MSTGKPNPQSVQTPQPRVLIDEDRLRTRIRELAEEIERDFADSEKLIAVGILKGSAFFMIDLLKEIKRPVMVDFLQTASYGAGTEPGEVRIRKDLDLSIRGADVLLIEDIVDTGYTLRTVLDLLHYRRAKSVKLCTLLDKKERRQVEVPIDYMGFEVPDVFVVGYGLDYNEIYRNLPFIGVFDDGIPDV